MAQLLRPKTESPGPGIHPCRCSPGGSVTARPRSTTRRGTCGPTAPRSARGRAAEAPGVRAEAEEKSARRTGQDGAALRRAADREGASPPHGPADTVRRGPTAALR
ncbi:hypothetical protein GCM10022630_33610 [Thermobifida alba]